VRRHPELRRELRLGMFTRGAHARFLLLAPWLLHRDPRDRSRAASVARLPVRTARQGRALGVALAEAARERTLVL
jgi:hypothetical protein